MLKLTIILTAALFSTLLWGRPRESETLKVIKLELWSFGIQKVKVEQEKPREREVDLIEEIRIPLIKLSK